MGERYLVEVFNPPYPHNDGLCVRAHLYGTFVRDNLSPDMVSVTLVPFAKCEEDAIAQMATWAVDNLKNSTESRGMTRYL